VNHRIAGFLLHHAHQRFGIKNVDFAQTGRLLSEYCITFPDETRPYGSARLPDSDDVLAKWMALTGDEDILRARVLEELSRSAGSLGRMPEAERWRREALSIARRRDERPMVQRLVALARE